MNAIPPALVLPLLLAVTCCVGCASKERRPEPPDASPRIEWALAIHGGAGVPADGADHSEQEQSLREALSLGRGILNRGGSSVEAVVAIVERLENDPLFNAGRGAVFTSEGTCELDASLMDGSTRNCGAVSGVTTVKNPIRLAAQVMYESRHVFLVGRGAETFAAEQGLELVENTYFQTDHRREQWERARGRAGAPPRTGAEYLGTVGAVALDRDGNIAAATSTGGLTNKRYGRVGDSPIIGAGTFADNASCGVSCTGQGELFIRHGIAHALAARVEFGGQSLGSAARQLLTEVLPEDSGGLIAIDRDGNIVMEFNTAGMYRGAADARGRYEVGVFRDKP